jgi:alkylhydroperoxidase/carboxymuconolactone decarboxylase family protein YurZ
MAIEDDFGASAKPALSARTRAFIAIASDAATSMKASVDARIRSS